MKEVCPLEAKDACDLCPYSKEGLCDYPYIGSVKISIIEQEQKY